MEISLLEKFQNEIAVMMSIQHLGNASIEDIHTNIKSLKKTDGNPFKIQLRSIQKICENLRTKGFVSIGYEQTDSGSHPFYKMQKGYVKFPETAQIKDVIKDDSVQALINEIESKKGGKKVRIDRKYYIAKITWKVLDSVAGGQPNESGIRQHLRNEKGEIIFSPNHFKRYMEHVLKLANKSVYLLNDIGFGYGYVKLNGNKPYVYKWFPSVRGDIRGMSGGASQTSSEMLPKGTIIQTEMMIPGNVLPEETMKKALSYGGRLSPKGFGAYSSRWGKLELENFEVAERLGFDAS